MEKATSASASMSEDHLNIENVMEISCIRIRCHAASGTKLSATEFMQ